MRYRERLTPPLSWWVLLGLFSMSMLVAFGFYLGPLWGICAAVATFSVMAAVFLAASTVIVVTDSQLLVGRANIELPYLGEIIPLDAQ
ncbi:MAG: DUF3093 family protein, partial [Propionibacteriaceae bacterium]|nr:DUF3093 family protein [Propionibacteriaceae bacterium]